MNAYSIVGRMGRLRNPRSGKSTPNAAIYDFGNVDFLVADGSQCPASWNLGRVLAMGCKEGRGSNFAGRAVGYGTFVWRA
jgi:hypothetical protein